MGNNKHANKKVLGNILKELMTLEGRVYRGKEIKLDMSKRFKISLSYSQAWRAKCYAIELLRGTPAESFRLLPLYLHNLDLHNPGCRTHLRTDSKGRFVDCYISIGAAMRTFVNHCRPIVIIDAAHLKGGYLGTNFLAVAMDGNNGILPLAYGIGAGETADAWTCFLQNLRAAIESAGGKDNLTFISDRHVSIAAGLSAIFPEAFHAICAHHLLGNLKTRSSKVKNFKFHYWGMIKAYRKSIFDHHFRVFSRHLPNTTRYLEEIGKERWSRHHALHSRYSYMTSNSAESINSMSRHARKLPVTMLMEFFRSSLQQWYYEHRNTGDKLKTPVTPFAEHKIGKRNAKSRGWTVTPVTNTMFEVMDGRKNGTVDLDQRTCTCMQWQLSGCPCGHVLTVARHFNQDDVSCYVEDYFSVDRYRESYREAIYPMPHPSEWVDPGNLEPCLPPEIKKRQSGRPKEHARIPSQGEEKPKRKQRCTRCKEAGHSRTHCMAPFDRSDEHIGSSSQASVHLSHP